jgi:hypothetical protein
VKFVFRASFWRVKHIDKRQITPPLRFRIAAEVGERPGSLMWRNALRAAVAVQLGQEGNTHVS